MDGVKDEVEIIGSEFVVVDRLETIAAQNEETRQIVADSLDSIKDLQERVETMEDRMCWLYQMLDSYRALALFVLPIAFAYIAECMVEQEPLPVFNGNPSFREPQILFMVFRTLCVGFSLVVALPALINEAFIFFHKYDEDWSPTPPAPVHRTTQTNDEIDYEDESSESDSEQAESTLESNQED